MTETKYLIIGAGPSGLAFAHGLMRRGERSFLVLEKEAGAGGLCRSLSVDNAPLDIGGGHFLDVKLKPVLDFVFSFMPRAEWREFKRKSTIRFAGAEIDYPFESNLWQLPAEKQAEYLESIAKAGSNTGRPMPAKFSDWIRWKLGSRVAEDYMLPYNRKIWSTPLDRLGTYWMYKLPDVSFKETLSSCLLKKPAGKIPAHGVFLYPARCGYGELWTRMALGLGNRVIYNARAHTLDFKRGIVNSEFKADIIVNTAPWHYFEKSPGLPDKLRSGIKSLKHAAIEVAYRPKLARTAAHWTYFPDERLSFHRTVCRANFIEGAKGGWTETNLKRAVPVKSWRHVNEYAYPLNTLGKPEIVKALLGWCRKRGVHGLGRWGEWEHKNSDIAVESALALARRIK